MTLTEQQLAEAVEAMARAYDKEDAAQRGEPDPWDIEFDDEFQFEEFRAERLACAQAALTAALPIIERAVLEKLSEPDKLAALVRRCMEAPIIGEHITIDDYMSFEPADAIDLGIVLTEKNRDGSPRFHWYSDIRGDEFAETGAEIVRRMLSGALRALAEEARG